MKIRIFSKLNWMGRRRWYFTVIAANREPVAQSEGYANRRDCEHTARLIKDQAAGAQIELVRA